METVWVGLGATEAQERVAATSGDTEVARTPATYAQLQRDSAEGRARWTRIHPPAASRPEVVAGQRLGSAYRIGLAVGAEQIGSLWAIRSPLLGEPLLEETRLLAATADQIGQAIHRERLARQAMELEVARRSDELKSALLVSVSHDLRTPLAAIRAAAGNLADPQVEIEDDQRRAAAAAIDGEAQRLNRLVGNLIDMSRIEGRDLAPDLEAIPLGDAVETVVERLRPMLADRPVELLVPADLPPVRADATLLDQVLTNLLENVARHTPPGTPVRIQASAPAGSAVQVTIEDQGPGVPQQALPRLFERFYHAGPPRARGRSSSGLGLAVVRGFVEAMGGHVLASRGDAGGLRISLSFATHEEPAEHRDG
jgi:two-component system sensor histidine kinase KdpD